MISMLYLLPYSVVSMPMPFVQRILRSCFPACTASRLSVSSLAMPPLPHHLLHRSQ